MTIIELAPLKNGAHRNQTTSGLLPVPNGWAVIPEEMAIPETFPFVGVEAQAGIVTALTPGIVPKPESEPIPTMNERMEKLENENSKLKSQLQMQAQQQEFLENCLLEMGDVVYA